MKSLPRDIIFNWPPWQNRAVCLVCMKFPILFLNEYLVQAIAINIRKGRRTVYIIGGTSRPYPGRKSPGQSTASILSAHITKDYFAPRACLRQLPGSWENGDWNIERPSPEADIPALSHAFNGPYTKLLATTLKSGTAGKICHKSVDGRTASARAVHRDPHYFHGEMGLQVSIHGNFYAVAVWKSQGEDAIGWRRPSSAVDAVAGNQIGANAIV